MTGVKNMSRFTLKKFGSATVDQHIAEITGQQYHYRPYAWIDNGVMYSHITGGVVMPTFDQPGYLLTIGVSNEDQSYHCLDEFESLSERDIYDRAKEIQTEYGQAVIETWWGEPGRLMSIVNQNNIQSEYPVNIAQPPDYDAPDAFQIYITSLSTALRANNKVMFLNGCMMLRNHILAFHPDEAKQDKNLALFLAGSMVHALNIYRPWEQAVEVTELVPTAPEDYYEYEHRKALETLEAEIYG